MKYKGKTITLGKMTSFVGYHNIATWAKLEQVLIHEGPQPYEYLCGVAFNHGCGNHKQTYDWSLKRRGDEFVIYCLKNGWLVEA